MVTVPIPYRWQNETNLCFHVMFLEMIQLRVGSSIISGRRSAMLKCVTITLMRTISCTLAPRLQQVDIMAVQSLLLKPVLLYIHREKLYSLFYI